MSMKEGIYEKRKSDKSKRSILFPLQEKVVLTLTDVPSVRPI